MRLITTVLFAAGLAAAMPAAASDYERASNTDYIAAMRCQGVARAGVLADLDAKSLDTFIRKQAAVRDSRTERKARAARREAQALDGAQIAQASQICAAWLPSSQMARGDGAARR